MWRTGLLAIYYRYECAYTINMSLARVALLSVMIELQEGSKVAL